MVQTAAVRTPRLLLVGIALLALLLRSPLLALPPVAGLAEADYGVGPAAFGLLTSLPVLCFALTTPLAGVLARRIGIEAAVTLSIAGVVVAIVLRSIGPYWFALAATVLLGTAITVGNVLIPALIRRDVAPGGRAAATGMYAVALNLGTVGTTLSTVPLAAVLGWRVAAAAWSVVGVVVLIVWLVLLAPARRAGTVRLEAGPRVPLGRLGLLLSVTFAAQAFSFYGTTAWLPTLLGQERHLSAAVAGSAASVFQLAGIGGAIGVPLAASRMQPRTVLAVIGVLWISLPVGLLLVPEHFILVSVTGGIAQGGGFAAIFTIIASAASDARAATGLSAAVQSAGYLVAAAAPPVVGGLHQLTGGWTAPMAVVLVSTVAFLVFGVAAARVAQRGQASATA